MITNETTKIHHSQCKSSSTLSVLQSEWLHYLDLQIFNSKENKLSDSMIYLDSPQLNSKLITSGG